MTSVDSRLRGKTATYNLKRTMNLASRYNAIPGISLGTKLFLHLRWWLTPYERMAAYVPKSGKVLDVGCGHGLLAMEMALSAPNRTVLATDHDVARIALAQASWQRYCKFKVRSQHRQPRRRWHSSTPS